MSYGDAVLHVILRRKLGLSFKNITDPKWIAHLAMSEEAATLKREWRLSSLERSPDGEDWIQALMIEREYPSCYFLCNCNELDTQLGTAAKGWELSSQISAEVSVA